MTRIGGFALALAGALLLGACDSELVSRGEESAPAAPPSRRVASESTVEGAGSWRALPPAPLSARHRAAAVWTGREVLVLGGTLREPCPPNASCAHPPGPVFRDGAAYDPVNERWRPIAEAPMELLVYSTAVLGDRVAVLGNAGMALYDVGADRWRMLPSPRRAGGGVLVAMGAELAFVQATHELESGTPLPDLRWDEAAGDWRPLPPDPLGRAYDRTAVWTGRELVLLGAELVPNPGAYGPSLVRAAAFHPAAGVWRTLPDSEVVAVGAIWHAAGGLVVSAAGGSADGGGTNGWGRSYPFGAILDPAAGAWRPLPTRPDGHGAVSQLSLSGGEVVLHEGWLLHAPTGTWIRVPGHDGLPDDETAATWAGDRLFLWGGVRWQPEGARGGWTGGELLDAGWSWRPLPG